MKMVKWEKLKGNKDPNIDLILSMIVIPELPELKYLGQ